jgi:hypothetical protein
MLGFEIAVGVLVDGEGIDDAYGVVLPELFERIDDLAVELGVIESEHDELDRTY